MIPESDIRSIRDFDSFLNFLRRDLGWRIPEGHLEVEYITYDFLADELDLDDAVRRRLQDDCIRQLIPFTERQPWGIFLVELHEAKIYTTFLRRLLRGLVPNRRTSSNLRGWLAENLLFICTPDYRSFTFAHFTGDKPHNAKLATFSWSPDEPIRTLCEYNLSALQWPDTDLFDEPDPQQWLEQWQTAFDVEKVTQKFFNEYKTIFDWTKKQLISENKVFAHKPALHSFTQKLFNRLLFLCFLQKKRWLDYNSRYLFELFRHAKTGGINFYADYLYYLFFWGLNQPFENTLLPPELQARLGRVPFLNGGLFEMDEWDAQGKVQIDNYVFERIFGDLLGKYNFTVTESTPLDIEVAIDPEMLGKVYEALISERNQLGSFYTPRIEVRLMCREALKAYLHSHADFRSNVIARNGETKQPEYFGNLQVFIDEERADALTENEAYDIYRILLNVKICDPAIGSGAFLVAMMNELVAIFRRLAS